ncbi:hypothetical protein ACP4OV_023776 [Aristida adscensionis]
MLAEALLRGLQEASPAYNLLQYYILPELAQSGNNDEHSEVLRGLCSKSHQFQLEVRCGRMPGRYKLAAILWASRLNNERIPKLRNQMKIKVVQEDSYMQYSRVLQLLGQYIHILDFGKKIIQ